MLGGSKKLIAAVRDDGKLLAFAGAQSGTIFVVDLNTGKALYKIRHQPGIVSLDIAADKLVVVGNDFRVDGWSLADGVRTSIINMPPACKEATCILAERPIYSARLSRDGSRVGLYRRLYAYKLEPSEWLAYEFDGRPSPKDEDFHSLGSNTLGPFVFSPDARTVFGIRRDRIYVGNTIEITAHGAETLAISREGKLLAARGFDGIRIWRVDELTGASPSPQPFAFLPTAKVGTDSVIGDLDEGTAIGLGGCLLATSRMLPSSLANVVSVWDCSRGTVLTHIQIDNPIRSVRLAPFQHLVVIQTANNVEAVNLKPAILEPDIEGDRIEEVVIRNDRILSCADGSLSYWDLSSGQLLRRTQMGTLSGDPNPFYVVWCAMMADRPVALFAAVTALMPVFHLTGLMDLSHSDVPSDAPIGIPWRGEGEPERTATSLILTPIGSSSVEAVDPSIWPQTSPSEWRQTLGEGDRFFANPEGDQVAVVQKGQVGVFDIKTKRLLWSEKFDASEVRFIGARVVLTGRKEAGLSSGQLRAVVRDKDGHPRGAVLIPEAAHVCQLSRDGDYATVCTETDESKDTPNGTELRMKVQLYHVSDAKKLEPQCCWIPERESVGEYDRQIHNPTYVRFSPDGQRWATLDGDKLKIWDLHSDSQLLELDAKRDTPSAFDMTDSRVALARGSTVEIYELPAGKKTIDRLDLGSTVDGVVWTDPQSILFWSGNRMAWRRLWTGPGTNPADALCKGIKTSLSHDEWNRYSPGGEPWRDTCQAWRERDKWWNSIRSRLL